MSESFDMNPRDEQSREEAAAWMWRLDRGLTSEEQDQFFDWLARDPKNTELLKRQRENWKRLDKLSAWRPEHSDRPNPDLLAPREKKRSVLYFLLPLAAAAAVVVSFVLWNQAPSDSPEFSSQSVAAKPEKRTLLEDGSTIKLNEDAVVTVLYTPSERRVRLEEGEAFFIVAKDPQRPFVVEVQGVDVSAIGTAFNVRMDQGAFEVLVAEGVVQVTSPTMLSNGEGDSEFRLEPLLEANQRAIISYSQAPSVPQVAILTKAEIQRVLAWQHGAMTFAGKPLAEIIDELNRLNDTQLTIVDPDLASERFTGTFLSSNVEGFVSVLKNGYGVEAKMLGTSEILLSKVVD